MIERVLAFSVRQRWLVLLAALAAVISGAWSLTRLPIDAVPDVTNVQVQINSIAPAFTPIEIEKQVTVPIETVLAGTPGLESTRSFSRNGFAQVTAVFADRTDIYFARQQAAERINEVKTNLPPGVEVKMGPISTGLGEVYWWSVEYAPTGRYRAHLHLDTRWKIGLYLVDAFGHLLACEVNIRPVGEDRRDLGETVPRKGPSGFEAGRAGEYRFDRNRDLFLDFDRRECGSDGVDLHLNVRYVRDGIDRQPGQRPSAGDRRRQCRKQDEPALPDREGENTLDHPSVLSQGLHELRLERERVGRCNDLAGPEARHHLR